MVHSIIKGFVKQGFGRQFNSYLRSANLGPIGNLLVQTGKKYLQHILTRRKDRYLGENKLEDLNLKTSTYLKDLNEIFGEMEAVGNVIWSTCVSVTEYVIKVRHSARQEHRHQHSYTASFAVAICRGPIDSIEKIYLNDLEFDKNLYRYRIYLGGEAQQPDPLLTRHLGAGKTPAFRDLCYIVFEDVELGEFEYKIPRVKCLIRKGKDISYDIQPIFSALSLPVKTDNAALVVPVRGIALNNHFTLHSFLDYVFLTPKLDIEGKIQIATDESLHKNIVEIREEDILPIEENVFFICENTNNTNLNPRLNYLCAIDFKVKTYLPNQSKNGARKAYSLPFAMSDNAISQAFMQISAREYNESHMVILRVHCWRMRVNVGDLLQVEEFAPHPLKVFKLIYRHDNTITLFCTLEISPSAQLNNT